MTARLDRRLPVAGWSARQLGVHPAIHGTGTPEDTGGFVLPEYVERDHDRRLRDRLRRGAADRAHPVLVFVRGPSSAGKTRTAFEAVRACLHDWELVFPKTPGGLAALLDAGALVPRTVLWLNEAQNHLDSPAGEEAAAALHRRLEEPGPLVVLGTLWPEYHRRLTAAPEPGAQAADAHPHARALLGQAAVVDVPASFTAEALADPRVGRDPSLAAAAASTGGQVTQTLAAGPQLVDHYRQPTGPHGPYGRAVITAALDARRLGHAAHLPAALLEAAASGYLTGEQRAAADPATWFDGALAYAQERVKGVAAALGPVPGAEGMGALAGVYGLNDYLDHHARTARRYEVPPASFWTAVRDHVTDAADLSALAEAAGARGRHRIAAELYRKAAGAGDTRALSALACLRAAAGHTGEAERLYRQALDAGHPAMTDLTRLREERGDPEGAERLAWQAYAAGDVWPLVVLAQLRETAGDFDGAERLAHRAARVGSYTVARHLVRLRDVRDPEGAERLALEVDFDGKSRVHSNLWYVRGESMEDEDWERTEGESHYRGLVDGGDIPALSHLARVREKAGSPDEAERLYRRAVDAGDTSALRNLARLRAAAGEAGEAELLYRQALDAGHVKAMADLARLYADAGDADRAQRLGRFGVEADGSQARPW